MSALHTQLYFASDVLLSYSFPSSCLASLLSPLMASYLPTDPLVLGLLNGLATALGVGLIHGLASGFTPQTLPEPHFLIPNEGIRRSTQRSLLFSLGAALLIVPLSMVQSTLKYTAYFDVPTDLDRQVST